MKADCSKFILCVEDDEDTCDILRLLFSQAGYEVVTAGTVAEGLRIAKEGSLALIILDNWYPEGSGIELCRQIRAFDSATPIIFYSGAGFESDIERALDAGAQAYIVKPMIEQLQQTVSLLIHEAAR